MWNKVDLFLNKLNFWCKIGIKRWEKEKLKIGERKGKISEILPIKKKQRVKDEGEGIRTLVGTKPIGVFD